MTDDGAQSAIIGDPLAGLRAAREDWSGGAVLDDRLAALEGSLGRSFLLDQPNVAGMGVAAWGLSTFEPSIGRAESATRRMLGGRGPLADLLGEDEVPRDTRDDPQALSRGADLIDAIETLDGMAAGLDDAPLEVVEQIERLRRDVDRRLLEEARLSPALRAHLAEAPDRRGLAARLRRAGRFDPAEGDGQGAGPDEVPDDGSLSTVRLPASADAPYADYTAALDAAVAREPAPDGALKTLRGQIRRAADRALQTRPDSAAGRRAAERARRLMAREVALTGGALGDGETAALRRALMQRETAHPRPEPPTGPGVAPGPGLPEVPIMSSRGEKARVVGYLAAGEATASLGESKGFVKVPAPGRARPGWVRADLLRAFEAQAAAEGLHWPPGGPAEAGGPGGGAGGRPSVDLARLAVLVARETGRPLQELMAELARPIAPETPPKTQKAQKTRRARGSAARAPQAAAGPPISIGRVQIDGLGGADAGHAAAALQTALSTLPAVLDARLRGDPERLARLRRDGGRQGELAVPLRIPAGGDPRVRGRVLAETLADALIASGARRVETLRVGVEAVADRADPAALFDQIVRGDEDGVAETLADERKSLDGTVRTRLARFFGHDFKDVMLFAGPMAGVLARSIQAEAFTHGKQVFFDPASFRPGSATGEALLAHELTHTRQEDDRDVRQKEAEAMITEAAYLDWLQPGGAPLAFDEFDAVTLPDAAAATAVAGGMMRARKGRQTMGAESGPRLDTARMEERVQQVLAVVRAKLEEEAELDAQRTGRLGGSGG